MKPARLLAPLLLLSMVALPAVAQRVSLRPGAGGTLVPVDVPDGAVVTTYASEAGDTTVVFDPDEAVRRIVVFETPPLARLRGAAGKTGAAAAAALDAEHARFRADVAALAGAASKHGGPATTIDREYRMVLNGAAVSTTRRVADRLAALPYVRAVYEDRSMRMLGEGAREGRDALLAVPRRAVGGTGAGVVVAVIDTGVDYLHPALGGGFGPGARVVGGYDFIDDDDDPMDENGHGTHVAGIVAGDDPAAGFTGVAPGATLLAYRVLDASGFGPTSGIIAAIERAVDPDGDPSTDDGADVLNLSLGGAGYPDDPGSQAVDHATAAGVVVVVAAGNSGRPSSIDSPGAARTALTVGAVDAVDGLAGFSSRGPVAATFENKPDVLAPGVDIRSALPGGKYEAMSGTSMATPYVAGAVALLLEQHPSWDPATVKAALMLSARDTGRHLWEQGSGRIDVAAAGALPAVVSPATVSFGNLDPAAPAAAFEQGLTIRNLSGAPQAFTLSVVQAVPGATVEVRPASVQLAPGAAETVTLSARFETGRLPFPQQIEVPYAGHVVVSGGPQPLRVPFSVTKTPQLVLHYDQAPESITILGDRGGVASAYYPADVASFPLAPGTYDVLSTFRLPHGEGYTNGYLLRERVAVAGRHDVQLAAADVRHPVTFAPVDADGQPLPVDYRLVRFQHVSGFSATTEMVTAPVVYVSELSARVKLQAVMTSFSHPSGVDYVVPLAHAVGVSGPVTLANDPAGFREVRTRYHVPPSVGELFVVSHTYSRIGSTGMTQSSWYDQAKAAHHRLAPPFEQTVRYAPMPSSDFGYPYLSRLAYNTTGGGLPFDDGVKAAVVATSPAIHPLGDRLDVFAHQDFREPLRSTRDAVLDLDAGVPPLVFAGRTRNGEGQIRFDQFYRTALFHGRDGDIVGGPVAYTLSRGGAPVEQGTFDNDLMIRGPLLAETGRYALDLAFDAAVVDGQPVRGTAHLVFDTRSFSGRGYDPDPPYVVGLGLVQGGAMVAVLDPAQEGAVTAVVRDLGDVGSPRPATSVKLAVRRLGETAWTELAATRQGDRVTGTWPTGAATGYYAVRLAATDAVGNTLDYRAEPAFRVGAVAGNRPPAATRLVAPADGYETDLDTVAAPLAFRWRAAADPDAGQQLRYRFHLAGPGLDTTLATSDTALTVALAGRLYPGATYTWRVETTDGFVRVAPEAVHTLTTAPLGVGTEDDGTGLPGAFVLDPGYPNPFNPSTALRFGLPEAADVRLEVFDLLGRRLAVLAEGVLAAGYHTYTWDAAGLPSGLYLVRLQGPGFRQTRTVTLLK